MRSTAFGARFTDGFAYDDAVQASVEAARGGGSSEPTLFRPADDHRTSDWAWGRGNVYAVGSAGSFEGAASVYDATTPSSFLIPDPGIR